MTRINKSEMGHRCFRTDHNQARLINYAREVAHDKHGENSIECVDASDPKFLAILVEEVGEIAHAVTYDSGATDKDVANELLDVLAVAAAWLDAYRVKGVMPDHKTWLA